MRTIRIRLRAAKAALLGRPVIANCTFETPSLSGLRSAGAIVTSCTFHPVP